MFFFIYFLSWICYNYYGDNMKISHKIIIVISFLMIVLTSILAFYYKDYLYIFYRDNIIKETKDVNIKRNEYYKDKDYLYVSNTDNFIANDKQEILNVVYTILNSGVNEFTFYCDNSYKLCISDVKDIFNDDEILPNINNFVHPYNSYKNINVKYNKYGEITLIIEKNYSDDDIVKINNKVDEIINSEINSDMTLEEKIKKIHNYIINNSKYASSNDEDDKIKYSLATSLLFEGLGLCGAYADTMAIFLEKLEVDNYKIASSNHIWNLVNINEKYLHLDLTWDDPVTSDGSDKLEVLFFLITDTRLKELDNKSHNYNEDVYLELKK